MTQKRGRQPRRDATRRPTRLHVVEGSPPSRGQVEADEEEFRAPDDVIGPIAESLMADVGGARRPLDAEIVPGIVFSAVEQGIIGDAEERQAALTSLLTQVVEYAERRGMAEGLALLRVLSVLGPDTTRSQAAAAADRLAVLGVPDRPWASTVGRPDVLRSWHYGDIVGEQESVAVLFSYRGRDHVLTVLIDHVLGGGLKDTWIAEGKQATELRDHVALTAGVDPEIWFRDVDVATAAAVLRDALAAPTVPVDEEQVQDVAAFFHLTLARTQHLCRLAGIPAPVAYALPAL